MGDVGGEQLSRLWTQGAYPRAFTADEADSIVWRDNYIATFLERDLPQLGFRLPAAEMRRFWTMVAHYHGQAWNGAELSRALGVAQSTIRRYLDALTDALMVRQLQPWFMNTSKRLVRSPKVYLRDSGVLHRLLQIDDHEQLLNHPKVGASWEGFAIEQIAAMLGSTPVDFWGTQSGAELDLLAVVDGERIGFEFKRADAPRATRSMHNALTDVELDRILVIHPGPDRYPIRDRIDAVPLAQVLTEGL